MKSSFLNTSAQIDAITMSDRIKERLVDLAASDNYVKDANLANILRQIWENEPKDGGLVGDIWVEGVFPPKPSHDSLITLAENGMFDSELVDLLKDILPDERKLYTHQAEAVKYAAKFRDKVEKPAIVISADTGAGKTEAFLLPMLNQLKTLPKREPGEGIQCLILYPMNALVNDQMERIYQWLRGQENALEITCFHFTSETPEHHGEGNFSSYDPCRMQSRQEARGWVNHAGKKLEANQRGFVPDIVITNYSMLEYMLCRPQDQCFFGRNLQVVVLDEVHLYNGTLAAEMTLLLRRLYDRCGVQSDNVMQLATSATLGDGSPDKLQKFASTLFTKDKAPVKVLLGERSKTLLDMPQNPYAPGIDSWLKIPWGDRPTLAYNEKGDTILMEWSEEEMQALRESLPVASAPTRHAAEYLYNVLPQTRAACDLSKVLSHQGSLKLSDLAKKLWKLDDGEGLQATRLLLQLGASARKNPNEYPRIPHRPHLQARSSSGVSVCLNQQCKGKNNKGENKLRRLGPINSHGTEKCAYCDSACFVVVRCTNCGAWELTPFTEKGEQKYFCVEETVHCNAPIAIDLQTGKEVADGARLYYSEQNKCHDCGEKISKTARPIGQGSDLPITVLAETVLAQTPPIADENRQWLPAQGRRLLAFSDSRSAAARLGPRLSYQHEMQLFRAAVVKALEGETPIDEKELLEEIDFWEGQLSKNPASENAKDRLAERKSDLAAVRQGGTVEDWATELKKVPSVAQIIFRGAPGTGADDDPSSHHQIKADRNDTKKIAWDDQTQLCWEKNCKGNNEYLGAMLGRELARLTYNAPNLQMAGIVEVNYPGIEELNAPSKLLGIASTAEVGNQIEENWTDILKILLDTLRMDGAITLGKDEYDQAFPYGSYLVGRWMSLDDRGFDLLPFRSTKSPKEDDTYEESTQRRTRFVERILGKMGVAESNRAELARDILKDAFEQLYNGANRYPWIETGGQQKKQGGAANALHLRFPALTLRRPKVLFRCHNTGRIVTRHVLGASIGVLFHWIVGRRT